MLAWGGGHLGVLLHLQEGKRGGGVAWGERGHLGVLLHLQEGKRGGGGVGGGGASWSTTTPARR